MRTLTLQEQEAASGGVIPILPVVIGVNGVEAIGVLAGVGATGVAFLAGLAFEIDSRFSSP